MISDTVLLSPWWVKCKCNSCLSSRWLIGNKVPHLNIDLYMIWPLDYLITFRTFSMMICGIWNFTNFFKFKVRPHSRILVERVTAVVGYTSFFFSYRGKQIIVQCSPNFLFILVVIQLQPDLLSIRVNGPLFILQLRKMPFHSNKYPFSRKIR